jgi:hypothetical protein
MTNRMLAWLGAAILALGLVGCETYSYGGAATVHRGGAQVSVVFTDGDRRILHDYYRVDYRALPPGLAKKGKVPPGHAYRHRVNQPLPPDAVWYYLPYNVERQLSRLPGDYVRIMIGADVAIMNVHTRVIVDLIENIHD